MLSFFLFNLICKPIRLHRWIRNSIPAQLERAYKEQGILPDIARYYQILPDIVKYCHIAWNLLKLYWNTTEYLNTGQRPKTLRTSCYITINLEIISHDFHWSVSSICWSFPQQIKDQKQNRALEWDSYHHFSVNHYLDVINYVWFICCDYLHIF